MLVDDTQDIVICLTRYTERRLLETVTTRHYWQAGIDMLAAPRLSQCPGLQYGLGRVERLHVSVSWQVLGRADDGRQRGHRR